MANGMDFDAPLLYTCESTAQAVERRLEDLCLTSESECTLLKKQAQETQRERAYLRNFKEINRICDAARASETEKDLREKVRGLLEQSSARQLSTAAVLSLVFQKITGK